MSTTHDSKNSWVLRGRAMLERLGWLTDANTLDSEGGMAFGRSIEQSVKDLTLHQGVKKLQIRRKDSAVVMSIEHYDELVELKKQYEELLAQAMDMSLNQATNDFDRLFAELASPASRKAADSLFTASPDDLRDTYSPGQTERGE